MSGCVVEGVGERVRLGALVALVRHEGLAVGEQGGAGVLEGDAALPHHGEELPVAHRDRVAEDVHLRAVVVHVVLALHVVAHVLEDAAERVPDGDPAAVADVERSHGVRGDELHLDLGARAHVRAGVVEALLPDGAEDLVGRGRGEVEVDEAGPGDLHAVDRGVLGKMRDYGVGDLTRRAAGELCRAHGDRRAPVTVARVGGALEPQVGDVKLRQFSGLLRCGDGGANELLDLLGHLISSTSGVRRPSYHDFLTT